MFGFSFDLERDLFQGTYQDQNAGVRLRFTGFEFAELAGEKCFDVTVTYASTDPSNPGSGEADIAACDAGEPGWQEGDTLDISITSGPFGGYSNSGVILKGNLKSIRES